MEPHLPRLPGDHADLDQLPAEVAERLEFDNAAPKRLTASDRLPPEVRGLFREIWNGVVADVYVELSQGKKRGHFSRKVIGRVLERVADRLHQSQTALVVAGVYFPFPGGPTAQTVTAGAAGGTLTGVEEAIAYTSTGAGAAAAVTTAMMGELLDVYLAASARTRQYRTWGRMPSPELIARELAEARGLAEVGPRARAVSIRVLLRQLGDDLVRRTGRRFFKGLAPVVGVALNAFASGHDVHRLTRQPPEPVDADEADRLRRQAEPPPYEETLVRLLQLAQLPPPPVEGSSPGAVPQGSEPPGLDAPRPPPPPLSPPPPSPTAPPAPQPPA